MSLGEGGALFCTILKTFGAAEHLTADWGTTFIAHDIWEFQTDWEIKPHSTVAYHPHSNLLRVEGAILSNKRLI